MHYRDAGGTLHVIFAPGVELPASYERTGVVIETVEEAIAIHVAARTAAAATINVAAAKSRLDAKPSTSYTTGAPSAADNSSLTSTRMQLVLPRFLASRREQALALQIMADQEREADLAQQERLVGDFELKDRLDQNEALTVEVSALIEETRVVRRTRSTDSKRIPGRRAD